MPRSPVYPTRGEGECHGAHSRILDEEQWRWLEQELTRTSEVTVIASGMQVGGRGSTAPGAPSHRPGQAPGELLLP